MPDDLKLILTEDGSHTLFSENYNSTYHSIHGAIQESKHVFIKDGLDHFSIKFKKEEISVLETGFGTGLNAFLSFAWAIENKVFIKYHSIEKHPISLDLAKQLNYPNLISLPEGQKLFEELHKADLNTTSIWKKQFELLKSKEDFTTFDVGHRLYDIIFFDPFDFSTNPVFWEKPFLQKLHSWLNKPGMLITYGAKGSFKRALKDLGFNVEGIPGPPGKREISRAMLY